jgi:hypothetical protein
MNQATRRAFDGTAGGGAIIDDCHMKNKETRLWIEHIKLTRRGLYN